MWDRLRRIRDRSANEHETGLADALETAVGNASDAVLVLMDDRVAFANRAGREYLTDVGGELRLDDPDLMRLVASAKTDGPPVEDVVTLWAPGPRPTSARVCALPDGTTVMVLSDRSESFRLDRVRRDFVANVSHELKTPVAGMRALAESAATALGARDTPNAVEFVERLTSEAARLAELVENLLDLSRVENREELRMRAVALSDVFADAVDACADVAAARDISIAVVPTDVVIEADVAQLTMALKNLVDNAVRYSESGTVHVGARTEDGRVTIEVRDEGIGIPADELPRIFERFYRVDKARSRATGGTGLGLAIVRHVAENHRGSVAVQSEVGTGSTFAITLPLVPQRSR